MKWNNLVPNSSYAFNICRKNGKQSRPLSDSCCTMIWVCIVSSDLSVPILRIFVADVRTFLVCRNVKLTVIRAQTNFKVKVRLKKKVCIYVKPFGMS